MKDEDGKFLVYFKGGVANGKVSKSILSCCFSKNGIMNVWWI